MAYGGHFRWKPDSRQCRSDNRLRDFYWPCGRLIHRSRGRAVCYFCQHDRECRLQRTQRRLWYVVHHGHRHERDAESEFKHRSFWHPDLCRRNESIHRISSNLGQNLKRQRDGPVLRAECRRNWRRLRPYGWNGREQHAGWFRRQALGGVCCLSSRLLSWRFALLTAIALLSRSALAKAPDPEIQRTFVEGGRLLQAGEYAEAERIFRALLQETKSPRIKLELARTLFYEKRYREARALFKEVLLEPDIPWQVRDNVDTFIRQIDNIIGYVKGAVSVVSDTNPENITSQREFTIGGIRLTFQPPAENKKVTGVRYLVDAFQPVWQEGRLSAYLTGAYIDYPAQSLDRLTMDMGLTKGLDEAGRAALKGGVEWGTFAGKALYSFPYVAWLELLSQSSTYRITSQVKAGRVTYPYYTYLDGNYLSVTASGIRAMSATTAASLGVTAEGSSAREKPYSYTGLSVAPGFVWLLSEPALLIKANASYGDRRYAAIDPLFGVERDDAKTWAEVTIRSKAWRLFNFTPVLLLSVEKNRSNIDYYSYRKVNFSIGFE